VFGVTGERSEENVEGGGGTALIEKKEAMDAISKRKRGFILPKKIADHRQNVHGKKRKKSRGFFRQELKRDSAFHTGKTHRPERDRPVRKNRPAPASEKKSHKKRYLFTGGEKGEKPIAGEESDPSQRRSEPVPLEGGDRGMEVEWLYT